MMLKCDVRHALVGLAILASSRGAPAQDSAASASPLFAADTPLQMTVHTDIRTLLRDRGEERTDHKGIARVSRADGGGVDSAAIELRTRGVFRRRPGVCPFPPLRLSIGRRAGRDTPFEGERRIKLVTHCRNTDQYEQYVLQEYLIYRAYALLTDLSLRTRLARITYEDAAGREKPVTRYGILIEHEDRLAERHRMRVLEDTGTHIARLDPAQTVFMAVFQYFIGNTDWSIRALHNIVLLTDSAGRVFPVPYDFDWSGVIATRYAQPDTSLPIRSVKERLYSGYCGVLEDFEPVFARFRERRAAIEALYDLEPLERDEREKARRYYAEFFRLIDDPARVRREMLKLCQ
ncbi:MAG TPA: hypothetical protein VJ802_13920 [Gemmatimonadaceae bacterium]|nr:hypothetical protein [Gemmatimonadaceae bacterium]